MQNFTTHNVITTDDYLEYYMYTISTNEATIKQRKRLRNLLVICLAIVAVWSIWKQSEEGSPWVIIGLWVVFLPITYFFYQKVEKNKYTKFFRKYIATNHQENMAKGHELVFGDDALVIKFPTHDLTMPYSEITSIYQNQNGIYIKNVNEGSFIFPSSSEDFGKIKQVFEEVADRNHISFVEDSNWKWK